MAEKKNAGKKIKINDTAETKKADSVETASDINDSKKEKKKKTEDPVEEIKMELETTKQEAKETYDRFLRVSAEFENYKKRSSREMDDFRKFANESLIKELLPVVDNLERAIDSSDEDKGANHSIVEGVHMTHKEMLKVFDTFNVKPIDALGKPFDPGFHQAVMQEETENDTGNTVLKEFQKGYLLHDRLLRPAMVVVSKQKENRGDDGGGQEDQLPEQDKDETK